jgi:hypothetical protein
MKAGRRDQVSRKPILCSDLPLVRRRLERQCRFDKNWERRFDADRHRRFALERQGQTRRIEAGRLDIDRTFEHEPIL